MTNSVLLDPTNELRPQSRPRADRPGSLSGLTVGLLDISKARGDVFMDRLSEILSAEGLHVERYRKPTYTKPAPLDLRAEIARRCDAVIEALAD